MKKTASEVAIDIFYGRENGLSPFDGAKLIHEIMLTAAQRIERLEGALRVVINHWNEFGPEHGMDETMHQANMALRSQD